MKKCGDVAVYGFQWTLFRFTIKMVGSLQSLIKSMARVKAVINAFQTVECGNQAGEERIDLLISIHSVVGQFRNIIAEIYKHKPNRLTLQYAKIL